MDAEMEFSCEVRFYPVIYPAIFKAVSGSMEQYTLIDLAQECMYVCF